MSLVLRSLWPSLQLERELKTSCSSTGLSLSTTGGMGRVYTNIILTKQVLKLLTENVVVFELDRL